MKGATVCSNGFDANEMLSRYVIKNCAHGSSQLEFFSWKSQVRFPRWVFWDGIFTAVSEKNTLFGLL